MHIEIVENYESSSLYRIYKTVKAMDVYDAVGRFVNLVQKGSTFHYKEEELTYKESEDPRQNYTVVFIIDLFGDTVPEQLGTLKHMVDIDDSCYEYLVYIHKADGFVLVRHEEGSFTKLVLGFLDPKITTLIKRFNPL